MSFNCCFKGKEKREKGAREKRKRKRGQEKRGQIYLNLYWDKRIK